jgi:hypothetical protein
VSEIATALGVGAALALGVLLLVALFGIYLDHRDDRRHQKLEIVLTQIQRTMGQALGQYTRLDGEVRDLREVADDHAQKLRILLPKEEIRRPKP